MRDKATKNEMVRITVYLFVTVQVIDDDGPEESLTSKEFDRFLAERAAAADNLPTITSRTGSTNSASTTPRHKPTKDDESLLAL